MCMGNLWMPKWINFGKTFQTGLDLLTHTKNANFLSPTKNFKVKTFSDNIYQKIRFLPQQVKTNSGEIDCGEADS